jgi:filamentous hemagglutinin family protein
MAQVVADGSTATTVTVNPDGSVTVGIAPVTRNGVSLNRYDDFNVAPPGLVLDNKTEAARTIVNEVTGTGTSTLAGDVGVDGQRAHVIIANPNGIILDGARFINTGRVALTTGQIGTTDRLIAPGITQMNVTATVTGGTITVAGGGLAGQMDAVDLIARDIRVNGPISNENPAVNAGLFLSAGASRTEFESAVLPGNVDPPWRRTSATGAASGGVLIELLRPSALGASRIGLQVTEAGAGVRMAGTALATAREFSLSASGDVVIEGATIGAAAGAALSAQSLRLTDTTIDGGAGAVMMQSQQGLAFSGSTVLAGDTLSLSSDGALTVTDSRLRAGRHVAISASSIALSGPSRRSEVVAEGGSLVATTTSGNLMNEGSLVQGARRISDPLAGLTNAEGAVTLNIGGSLINRTGQDLAVIFGQAGDVVVKTGGDVVNDRGRILSGQDVRIASVGDILNVTDLVGLAATPAIQQQTRLGKRMWWTFWLRRERHVETTLDFGTLLRTDRLATITATGAVTLSARTILNRGGEINANGGSVDLTALRVETIGLGSGKMRLQQVCGLSCTATVGGEAGFYGGRINASDAVRITAAESVLNLGGVIFGGQDVTVTSPSVRFEAIPLPTAIPRPRGLHSLFADGAGWVFWRDTQGSVTADLGRLAILSAYPVQVLGGDLRGASILIPGGQAITRLPGDLTQARQNMIGWFRNLPLVR